jgi:oxygen-dependent protoporphyrinogen oxidase
VVYQSGERPGGVVRTERRDGYLADLGPSSMAVPAPPVTGLLAELGLGGSLVPASPAARHRYVVRRGKLLPLPQSPPELLTTRLFSNAAKLAVFGEPLVEPGDSPVEESVAGFVRRRFNQEIVDYVANPFMGGSSPAIRSNCPSVRLPRLYALGKAHGSVIKAMIQRARAGARPTTRGRGKARSFPSGKGCRS